MSLIRYSPPLILILCGLPLFAVDSGGTPQAEDWHVRSVHVPDKMQPSAESGEILVAIVDDGLRKSHRELKDFIWKNPGEIPFNQLDDDGNGFIDDVRGWDVSDGDPNCMPPTERLEEYYHGTHVAGIITGIARAALGESASERIKLLPVKCLSDFATKAHLKSGFRGIEDAASLKADIIVCAWSVGQLAPEEARILQKASSQGALIIASAGNFPENREVFPAAHEAVFAVAGLNQDNRKMKNSNYGTFVDLSAPGNAIRSASSESDDHYALKSGTSQATAIVAAAAALVKLKNPSFSAEEIKVALKSSADALGTDDQLLDGRLGSGKLNVKLAVKAALLSQDTSRKTDLRLPLGYLRYAGLGGAPAFWELAPPGNFKGIHFKLKRLKRQPGKSSLKFFSKPDAPVKSSDKTTVMLADVDGPIFIPGQPVLVEFFADGASPDLEWVIECQADPVHLPSLYCNGTQNLDKEGTFEDGSGPQDYSPQSNCFWLIEAPPGKVIQFHFTEFDTQPGVDSLYFFDGRQTNKKIMAVLSGSKVPPNLTTWRNETLVWFVTDSQNQKKGWKAEYKFVDPDPDPPSPSPTQPSEVK